MTLCEQNIFGRTTCLTLTAKVKVGAAECQDMLGCVELNVDLSKCGTRTGNNVMWSRQQGQMSGECECSKVNPEHLPKTMAINFSYLFYQMITDGRAPCIDWRWTLIQ